MTKSDIFIISKSVINISIIIQILKYQSCVSVGEGKHYYNNSTDTETWACDIYSVGYFKSFAIDY